MSAVPPNHGVDRDRLVHHRGAGAHDEQFSEAEQHGRGGYVGGHHDRNWASSYQPGSVDAANFLLASALSGLWLQERVRVTNFARLSPVRPEVSANAHVLARDLDQIIGVPWREVGRPVTGSPDTPLHANAFGGFATRENIPRSQSFFRTQPIADLG